MHRPLPFHIYFYQPPRAYSDIWSIDTEILQARKQISSRSALIFSNVAPRKYISSLFSKERLQNKASSINHLSPINSLSPSTTRPNLLLQASRQIVGDVIFFTLHLLLNRLSPSMFMRFIVDAVSWPGAHCGAIRSIARRLQKSSQLQWYFATLVSF